MTALGWTWEYIDDCLTLPRLSALERHWRTAPPVHESVAAFLGITNRAAVSGTDGATGPTGDVTVDDSDDAGLALMRMFGDAGGIVTGV